MIRAAVLYFGKPSSLPKLKVLADALAEGMKSQGAQVEVIPGPQARDIKLTGYHYIAVGCDVRAILKGTLPPELSAALANGGIVTGKKSFAFVASAPLGTEKTLGQLMKALEKEGMMLRYSEAFSKADQAQAVGRRLKLD